MVKVSVVAEIAIAMSPAWAAAVVVKIIVPKRILAPDAIASVNGETEMDVSSWSTVAVKTIGEPVTTKKLKTISEPTYQSLMSEIKGVG